MEKPVASVASFLWHRDGHVESVLVTTSIGSFLEEEIWTCKRGFTTICLPFKAFFREVPKMCPLFPQKQHIQSTNEAVLEYRVELVPCLQRCDCFATHWSTRCRSLFRWPASQFLNHVVTWQLTQCQNNLGLTHCSSWSQLLQQKHLIVGVHLLQGLVLRVADAMQYTLGFYNRNEKQEWDPLACMTEGVSLKVDMDLLIRI